MTRPGRGMWGLVALFAVSGTMHFVRPLPFETIVPRRLPGRRRLVYASGAVELGCAAGLAIPASRRLAGLVSAVLLVMVFPANVQMAYDVRRRGSRAATALAVGRLPLQVPLVRAAWRARRR